MSDKEATLLDAAKQVFLRYGIKRTSMADIATQAGVSRQTLYNSFAGKDAIMLAVMQRHFAHTSEVIAAGLEAHGAVADQLDVILNAVVILPHATLSRSPHAAELMDGIGAISDLERDRWSETVRGFFAYTFKPYAKNLAARGMTPDGLATLAQLSCDSLKGSGGTSEELGALTATLKASLLASLGQA